MIDEEVTRSLEQEAIALVNLSNPTQCASTHEENVTPAFLVAEDAAGQEQDANMELLDGNISMKSLLVMLEKRKRQHSSLQEQSNEFSGCEPADETDIAKLPSFRTVFQPPQQETIESVPSSIKCKYRTGKCQNMRALKSCGDYHNLCNYHRLRANANQRKLDRKKKEQRRQQQQLTTVSALSLPLAQLQQPLHTPSHAAAAALASLVAAHPQHHETVLQQQRPFYTVQVGKNRSTNLRPKEKDACSY